MPTRNKENRRKNKQHPTPTRGSPNTWLLRVLVVFVVLVAAGSEMGRRWYSSSRAEQQFPAKPTSAPPLAASPAATPAVDAKPGAPSRKPNVLLLTLDSVRKDFLGCYGGTEVPTPHLDALAVAGRKFTDAFTVVPISQPSHASILTGLYPIRHGVRDDGPVSLADSHLTLAESLKAEGYATAAFVSAHFLSGHYGFRQGFDQFNDTMTLRRSHGSFPDGLPYRPGNLTVDAAIPWFTARKEAGRSEPWFAWIHLFDGQAPYTVPSSLAAAHKGKPYLGALAFLDEQIGRLVDQLRKLNEWDHTLVVLVGSHGEGLYEHAEESHSFLLYDTTVSIPLIWRLPEGLNAPSGLEDRMAATIDIVPTVLRLLGLRDSGTRDGIALFVVHAGKDERVVLMESLAGSLRHGWGPLVAARGPIAKFIDAPVPEFYSLPADPKETTNLLEANPEQTDTLRLQLTDQLRTQWGSVSLNPPDESFASSPLQSLADRGHKVDLTMLKRSAGRDPKASLQSYERHRIGGALLRSGQFGQAVDLFQGILKDGSADAFAWAALSSALLSLGQTDEALSCALRAAALQPRHRHWSQLARTLLQKGDIAALEIALDTLQKVDPTDGETFILQGRRALGEQRHADAAGLFEKARLVDPYRQSSASWAWSGELFRLTSGDAEAAPAYLQALQFDAANILALEGLAGIEQRAGRVDAEASYLKRLIQVRPAAIAYANQLAQLYTMVDREAEAAAVLEEFLARNRNDVSAIGNLGNVYLQTGRLDEALAQYRRAIQLAPDYTVARFNLGTTLQRLGELDEALEHFQKLVELRPDHAPTSKKVLEVLAAQYRLDEAFAELARAADRKLVDWDDLARTESLSAVVGDPRFAQLRNQYTNR